MQEMPCSEVMGYSCGQLCGRQLQCGNHTCRRICHTVINAQSLKAVSQSLISLSLDLASTIRLVMIASHVSSPVQNHNTQNVSTSVLCLVTQVGGPAVYVVVHSPHYWRNHILIEHLCCLFFSPHKGSRALF